MGGALVMLALLGLVALPGLVWHRAWLAGHNFSPLTVVVLALVVMALAASKPITSNWSTSAMALKSTVSWGMSKR